MVRLSSTIMMITSSGWTEQGISNPKVLPAKVVTQKPAIIALPAAVLTVPKIKP